MHRVTPWPEHARLRAESERIRAESIRVRIAAVHAYCSAVETEARWRSPETAQEMMSKVWRAIGLLKQHLAEPQHVPGEAAGELLHALSVLEERALRLQESLSGRGAIPRRQRKQPGGVRATESAGRDPQTSR